MAAHGPRATQIHTQGLDAVKRQRSVRRVLGGLPEVQREAVEPRRTVVQPRRTVTQPSGVGVLPGHSEVDPLTQKGVLMINADQPWDRATGC